MTTTEPTTQRDHVADARETLDWAMTDLPTVEELVRPVAQVFYRLHRLESAMWPASFLDDKAADEQVVLVRLIEEVASLLEAVAGACVHGSGGDALGRDMRRIIYSISGFEELRLSHYGSRVFEIAHRLGANGEEKEAGR